MRCEHVAEIVDLGKPLGLKDRVRFLLHLSLCQACKNYFDATKAIKAAIKNLVLNRPQSLDLSKLNRELLKKHAQSNDNLRK